MSDPPTPAPAPVPPPFGNADYQAAMLALMPRGIIWPRGPQSVQSETLAALAPSYTRSTAAALQVLVDASPATTQNLLPEWEESLGLPDPCTPASPTLEQRQANVRAKFAARGSMSVSYFITLAATLGFDITITEFTDYTIGEAVGLPMYGPAWAYAWQVSSPQIQTFYFEAGSSAVGDPLATFDVGELVCQFLRYKPAETIVFFSFTGGSGIDISPWQPLVSIGPGVITSVPTAIVSISPGVISGTVTALPAYTLSTTALSFPPEATATSSAAQTVTVTNTGTVPLIITGAATTGDFALTGVTVP